MASKLEELLSNSVFGLKRLDKPLPLRPQRPERLTNFFLPSSEPSSPDGHLGSFPGLTPQASPGRTLPPSEPFPSPSALPSPQRPPSFSGFALTPPAPASLDQRRYAEQRPSLVSKSIETRLTRMELENTNLRRANEVLYRQNSDYRELLQEYKALQKKANVGMDRHKGSVEVLEEITDAIRADVEVYQAARSSVQKVERGVVKGWKRFVDANSVAGVEVEKVVKDIVDERAMDIRVYPYKKDPNMI